jgi:hypothetical protein
VAVCLAGSTCRLALPPLSLSLSLALSCIKSRNSERASDRERERERERCYRGRGAETRVEKETFLERFRLASPIIFVFCTDLLVPVCMRISCVCVCTANRGRLYNNFRTSMENTE